MKTPAAAAIAVMLWLAPIGARVQPPADAATRTVDVLDATIRLAFVRTGDAPSSSSGPYAGFGTLLAEMLTPDGPVTVHYVVSGEAIRAQVDGRLSVLPSGSIVLERLGDSTLQILNPVQKTWYEVPAAQNGGTLLGKPEIELQPVHERTTIAGQPAERFRITETFRVTPPAGTAAPADFPSAIEFTGDLWSTDAFQSDAARAVVRSLQTFSAVPGLDAMTAGGRFPLRLYLRSAIMAGLELRTEVTSLTWTTAERSSFTVPSDYLKVQPPYGGGDR